MYYNVLEGVLTVKNAEVGNTICLTRLIQDGC